MAKDFWREGFDFEEYNKIEVEDISKDTSKLADKIFDIEKEGHKVIGINIHNEKTHLLIKRAKK